MSDDLTTAYLLGVENMRSRLHKQADEIERLRAENEKLREALKPFAGLMLVEELKWADYKILKDDIRTAAAAIRENGKDHGLDG